ncbi:response regulator, partial [Candidatus Saccharibacteria bacterium]|nr:response regulator [Calditrichia bacterium]NIV98567.1 response regulator [Candidatus Saccharibacteria bacterium]NIW79853.1 response regulator [Calditrichia bacterium]
MQFQILILDDEEMVCKSLKRVLEDKEKKVFFATSIKEGLEILKSCPIDLILLDYRLRDSDGITVLKEIREIYPEAMIIMITAYGNIEIAVEAMKLGAYDFIQKKEDANFIRFTVKRALDTLRLKKEVEELRQACQQEMRLPHIIAVSSKMQHLLDLAREYAKTDSTVLITGETGTGKGLLSQYIHMHSNRFNAPFVSINCAAIPHELLESELFGYEKGAFTGANQKGKIGLIEKANGGTLFLDEVSELTPDLQTKLLHVLETREFFRVGAVEPSTVDVRFIAATNANLMERVQNNQFRMDLYYRLNVATLPIPPLRKRQQDILPLTKHFIDEFNKKFNKTVDTIAPNAERFLNSSSWYGNVRELRNMVERAMLLKKDSVLQLQDFMGPEISWSEQKIANENS